MEELDANLFPIPPRSPDINPIENIFHMVRKTLTQDAMEQNITQESIQEFQERIMKTMFELPICYVDKTIASLNSRMMKIIEYKGSRLKY